MIATITNTSAVNTLNALDTLTIGPFGPAQINAVGGVRRFPLPHPFHLNGSIAPSGTKLLSIHPQDFRYVPTMGSNPEPRDSINLLLQAGTITISLAAETPRRDEEEIFANLV